MKPLVYTTETQTVSDFIGVDNINADPAHQRPQIQDNSKRKGIVQAMVDGLDIGEIKLNQYSSEPIELEVIDGSNRLRSIKQFFNSEFSISEMTFTDLSSDEKDIFLNYPLRYIIYDNLSPQEKAKQLLRQQAQAAKQKQEQE